jgi:lysophospholipase L1-like esterase
LVKSIDIYTAKNLQELLNRILYNSLNIKSMPKYCIAYCNCFILCVLLLLSSACSKKTAYTFSPITDTSSIILPLPSGTLKRILALGDSYTIGQSVNINERFPNQTIALLKSAGANMATTAEIIAQTGWTTQNLLTGISNASPAPTGTYDLVTLLIGVNNQYQQRDTAEYRAQFIQCLNTAIVFSGYRKQRVFVLSIPDYGATPFGASNAVQIGIEIDRFNAINKQVCIQMGIDYTDITPSTRMAVNNPALVANDGLHPSGLEYAKWSAMLKPKMLPLVQ